MDGKHILLAGIVPVGLANVAFAQANGNAQAHGSLIGKIAIGVSVWLVTAILAYVAWTLVKVIAKIGVLAFLILAGVATAILLPHPITTDAVMTIGIPCVLWGVAASLVCYLYANFFDIERELHKVEEGTPKSQG